MPIARAELVDHARAGLYHCISRCVRRAFLCGGRTGKYDHRRDWLEKRVQELTGLFAIDVVAYAIMSNHMHVLLWTDPERVAAWDNREVARRWLRLFPGPARQDRDFEDAARMIAADTRRVVELRRRLSSLSWFNRCLKEPLARRANAEDDCSGVFWEGRFKSYRVADQSAALTCAVYIDLNAIRAGGAMTPESSDHTSVKTRIDHRRQSEQQRRRVGARAPRGKRRRTNCRRAAAIRGDLWLTPFGRDKAGSDGRRTLFDFGVEKYLKLVDVVGRRIRSRKRGAIPRSMRPILKRIGDDLEEWLATLRRQLNELRGTTVGQPDSLVAEAARRNRGWVVNPLRRPG